MKHFKSKTILMLALLLLLSFSGGTLAADLLYDPNNPPQEDPVFNDIDETWSKDAVVTVWTYGIADGYEDNSFKPNQFVTRAEFCKLLSIVIDSKSTENPIPFEDVTEKHWAYHYVSNLFDLNIIKGISEHSFAPDAFISRQDIAVMLQRAADYGLLKPTLDASKDLSAFSDAAQISDYAVKGMNFTVQSGLLNGYPDKTILPLRPVSRGECAQILTRSLPILNYKILPIRITQTDWASYKQEAELSNGLNMSYVEMGQADGEPLILVHGSTDTSRSWSLAAPYLTDKYHVYIPDVRNHGDTGSSDDESTMRRMEEGVLGYDAVCFLDAIGVDRANFVGHSRGSRIVQLVALNFPERVSRLVSVSGHVVSENSENGRDMTYFEDPFTSIPIDAEYMDWWYYNDYPVDEEFLSMAKYESAWLPLEAWRAIGGSLAEARDFNKEIPFLALFGADDYLGAGADRQAKFFDNYGSAVDESIVYPGMGHNLQWENPEMIAKKIDTFISDTKAAQVAPPAEYEIGNDSGAPVKDTTFNPEPYYDKEGKLIKNLSSIPQGDWKEFKKYVKLESGISMAYIEMGNPEGEDLILLHGMTDSSRSWSLLTPYLSDYHLYIPDQRGHGDTDKPDMKKYDRSLFAYDLACFMDEMGLQKANIMGHSMGSMNAQAFAMDYPERVDHLILESTKMIGLNSENPADAENPYILKEGEESPLTWEYMEWWYYNPVPVEPVFHFNAIIESWKLPLKCWASINAVPYQARNIDCKTLVLYGGLDYLMGGETQDTVKKEFDEGGVDYTYIVYENRGHNIHWEESELIAEDVINFLNDDTDKLKDHKLPPYTAE